MAALFGLAGCSTNATRTNASLTTPLISIAITQAPPSSLFVTNGSQVSATVNNDIAQAGVDWVASCGSAPNCGTFSPSHTASGAMAVFTAPSAVPAHNTVTVMALSSTDRSKAVSAQVTILSTITGVTITQPPPASAPSGSLVKVAATVAGDPSNEGVDWKAACVTPLGTVDCTPLGFHSAPAAPVTFVVPGPLQIPGIVGSTIVLTALATADHSFSASASFLVSEPLSISLTQVPPSTMLINATAPVAATVLNDTTNAGVDWVVSCGNTPCGSVSPAHTASGATATFTAPPTVPVVSPPNPVVTIIATASATGSLTATANVTIVVPITTKITQGVANGAIVQNHSAIAVATVSGDTANAGVDWTVSCGSPGACGSFTPAHTASGAATTFNAPSAVPTGGSVTITAASTTDPTKTDTQTVTVTASVPPDNLLMGQFAMLLTAKNSTIGPYVLGGVISGDGAGHISGGTFDEQDGSGNGTAGAHPTSGVYTIGTDGRGQIHLQFSASLLPLFGSGAINMSVVFINPQHALLTEIDGFGTGTGTLDLQSLSSWAGLNGVYSLKLSGFNTAKANANYFLGSAVTIPSATSYSYITDLSDAAMITSVPFNTVSHGFLNGAAPDALTGELTVGQVNLGLPTPLTLDLWVIDATHLVVTDWRDPAFAGGYITFQPSTSSVSGTYAFTEAGATSAAQPLVAGGIFTCGSSGILDVVPVTGAGTPLLDQPISATCGAITNGRALITISGATTASISKFAAYPTSDQGLYLLELDSGAPSPSGAGVARQQTSNPISAGSLSGKYASDFLASTSAGAENFAGQIISNGASALSGTADVNSFTASPPAGAPSSGASLTGSYPAPAPANGRFPLVLTFTPATGQPTPQVPTLHPVCYVVDANTCLLLGLDPTAPGAGVLSIQNTGL